MRTLTVPDGATIAYRLWQPGRPRPVLALLHGVASNMTRWSEFVARTTLKDSWDLLRLDLRGQGASLHRGRIGMAEWCADLASVLDAEGYPQAVVAGHCLGANIALAFGARHLRRASGLILIEPMLPQALTGSMRRLARVRPLLAPAVWLIRALNALGIHRRRLASLDLEDLDRRTRAAVAAGGTSERLLKEYASPWRDLRMQLIFRNEPTGLTEDGAEGADIQTGVRRNSQNLSPLRPHTFQLHMAAPLGHNEKPERFEDRDNLGPGQPTKLGHRWDRLRG